MSDDAVITAAYDSVRSDKEPLSWLLISESPSKKLTLESSGQGTIEDLKTHLRPEAVQYGYLRQEYANDSESKRVKFVFIVWLGSSAPIMKKARASVQASEVKRLLRIFSIELTAEDKKDLVEEEIIARLRKAGGADYNGGRG